MRAKPWDDWQGDVVEEDGHIGVRGDGFVRTAARTGARENSVAKVDARKDGGGGEGGGRDGEDVVEEDAGGGAGDGEGAEGRRLRERRRWSMAISGTMRGSGYLLSYAGFVILVSICLLATASSIASLAKKVGRGEREATEFVHRMAIGALWFGVSMWIFWGSVMIASIGSPRSGPRGSEVSLRLGRIGWAMVPLPLIGALWAMKWMAQQVVKMDGNALRD